MPRLTEETQERRRRHVLESAWRCFAREGFQATTMDEIIAETGMSSSSVYRYFPGKEDLIASTAEESLRLLKSTIEGIDPVPASEPHDAVGAVVRAIDSRIGTGDPDMSRLAMNAWVEGLRDRRVGEITERFYRDIHRSLVVLAERWTATGVLDADADPAAVADLIVTLIPGMIVTHHLLGPTAPESLLRGVAAVADRRG